MTLFKAIRKAKKMSKIVNQQCCVIKVDSKVKWYLISTWFRMQNVTMDYIKFKDYKGKIYYKTK
jgi:hypothetical protein